MMESSIGYDTRLAGPNRHGPPPGPCDRYGEDALRRQAPGAGTRVFLVEDEGLIAMDMRERLMALGYAVCGTAESGDAAVKMIPELQPDLVLMDVKLAGSTDGVEAAQKLRERYDVPVVFLTAYSDSQLVDRVTKANCYGFLLKPVKEGQLHATLKLALARFRALR